MGAAYRPSLDAQVQEIMAAECDYIARNLSTPGSLARVRVSAETAQAFGFSEMARLLRAGAFATDLAAALFDHARILRGE